MLREVRVCDHCQEAIGPGDPYVEAAITHNREASDQEMLEMGMVATPPRPEGLAEGDEFDATPTPQAYRDEYGKRGGVPMVRADETTLHFCSDEHLKAKLA